jgi:uncharacterized repeat protein (TIGR01451 family)
MWRTAIGIATTLTMGLGLAGTAGAANDVELKTSAQLEVQELDEAGKPVTKLVPAAKVVPGEVVVYTISARNIADQAVDNIVINDAVPEHMTYVAKSASCRDCEISFSTDGGQSFDTLDKLTVTDDEGEVRKAEASDVTDIRWAFRSSLAPATESSVSFRARLD